MTVALAPLPRLTDRYGQPNTGPISMWRDAFSDMYVEAFRKEKVVD